jgi:hypothetical protein
MSYTPPATDPLGWRLVISEDSHGQQKWRYLPGGPQRDAIPQDQVTKYALGLDLGAKKQKKAKSPGEAARNGYEFYKLLQSSDGHFATEYGGKSSLSFDDMTRPKEQEQSEEGRLMIRTIVSNTWDRHCYDCHRTGIHAGTKYRITAIYPQ